MPDGSTVASTEAYRPNFRVSSCAFTWEEDGKLVSKYIEGEADTRTELEYWLARDALFVWHNWTFDGLVARCRFPDLPVTMHADTMRLAQVYDGGGGHDDFILVEEEDLLAPGDKPKIKRSPTEGLGLVKCVQRILGDTSDHKAEAYAYIMSKVNVKYKQCGSYLHLLPSDIMARYNCADTENTYRLYKFIVDHFRYIQYDWTFDHNLYMMSANKIIGGKIRGIRVDRPQLATYIKAVTKEIEDIGIHFRSRFLEHIKLVEADRLESYVTNKGKIKTEKGRVGRREKFHKGDPKAVDEVEFNPGSNSQLAALFVDKLGITPVFFTDKGAPSFKSAMLNQWGEGGEILRTRRKRGIVLKHSEALYKMSEVTGRFHPSLRTAGTKTGRYVGAN